MVLKVIGVGLSRTGTVSLQEALDLLGFGPCMAGYDIFTHPEILDTAFDSAKGKQVDWDALIGDRYQAAVGFPVHVCFQQLLDTYPDAKVILTVRDADTWYQSALETLYGSEEQKESSSLVLVKKELITSLGLCVRTSLKIDSVTNNSQSQSSTSTTILSSVQLPRRSS